MIDLFLSLVAIYICADLALSNHKYTEIRMSLGEAMTPPNGWLYKVVHPLVQAAREITSH